MKASKKRVHILLFLFGISLQGFSQDIPLSPSNNPADKDLIRSEASEMDWFMFKDSFKVKIGNVKTLIQKEEENLCIISTVKMEHLPTKWVDSIIVKAQDFKPIYHSSYNQQRDMVLQFGKTVTGYYLNKQSQTKTLISEEYSEPFFDSNFYPQLIRWLPLKDGYSSTISIFDYNPTAKIGVIRATIRSTEAIVFDFKGSKRKVWKVETTDDISDNFSISTYYIDVITRKVLRHEIDFGGRKMLMELVE